MPTILIVEDNAMNRDVLSRLLTRRGYAVTMANDGAEGLEAARRDVPDLILLDMGLPVIDGYEVARRLKADSLTAKVPVIALTARALSTDRDEALAAGCDDYDVKPVDLTRLMGKIKALLPPS